MREGLEAEGGVADVDEFENVGSIRRPSRFWWF
jgi:hypothetical protein